VFKILIQALKLVIRSISFPLPAIAGAILHHQKTVSDTLINKQQLKA
jgi:hypothetical protein